MLKKLSILVILVAMCIAAKPSKPSGAISMKVKDWIVTIGCGVSEHPTQSGTGWFIDLPVWTGALVKCNGERTPTHQPSLNYLVTNKPSFAGKSLLTMDVQVTMTGNPVFNYQLEPWNTCPEPANVRLLLQRTNDWSDTGRWWSNPLHLDLAEGFQQLNVPLNPEQWTGVFGESAVGSASFTNLVNGTGWVGMTFGGGCFFGHGVNVSEGTARFSVTEFHAS